MFSTNFIFLCLVFMMNLFLICLIQLWDLLINASVSFLNFVLTTFCFNFDFLKWKNQCFQTSPTMFGFSFSQCIKLCLTRVFQCSHNTLDWNFVSKMYWIGFNRHLSIISYYVWFLFSMCLMFLFNPILFLVSSHMWVLLRSFCL